MTKKPPCCNSSTGTTPTAANCGRRPPSAPHPAELGITDLWLPPAYKGASGGYPSATIHTICSISANLTRKAAWPPNTVTRRRSNMPPLRCANTAWGALRRGVQPQARRRRERTGTRVQGGRQQPQRHRRPRLRRAGLHPLHLSRPPGRAFQFIWDYTCFSGVDYVEQPDDKGCSKSPTTMATTAGTMRSTTKKATTTI